MDWDGPAEPGGDGKPLCPRDFAVVPIACGHFCGRFRGDGATPAVNGGNEAQNPIVAERLTRDRIIDEIQKLWADATLRDAIEHLVFVAKIDEGLDDLDAGMGIPHDEARRRLGV